MNGHLINLKYALSKVKLDWCDIKWALDKGVISWRDVIEFAKTKLDDVENYFEVYELATIGKEGLFRLEELLTRLAKNDTSTNNQNYRKWLFVRICSLLENWSSCEDPVGAVENIAAEFQFPSELHAFIRWMPAHGGVGNPAKYSKYNHYASYYDSLVNFLALEFDDISISGTLRKKSGTPKSGTPC